MKNWKEFFKGKRVTVMGLGLLGRGLGDTIFLAEQGADLTITDLRSKKILSPSLSKLKNLPTYKHINFVLGQHRNEDFRDRDFILKAAGIPLDSPFIAEARKNGIPIEMDASLFAKLAPEVNIIGVTGTRGKTTTTMLIYEIISRFKIQDSGFKNQEIHLGGNIKGKATLPLLEKVKKNDIVVLELDSWQLQGFGEAKISPHIAVFTNFLDDHLIYYKGDREKYWADKANIFLHQKQNDYFVTGEKVAHLAVAKHHHEKKRYGKIFNDPIAVSGSAVPADWKIRIPGEHNKENIALAISVAKILGIPYESIKDTVENFIAVEGRLQFLREIDGVKIYNDNNATTPDATIAALRALSSPPARGGDKEGAGDSSFVKGGGLSASRRISKIPPAEVGVLPLEKGESGKNIILICGGTDKGLDMSNLVEEIPKYCKAVILLKEAGTEKLISNFQFPISNQFSMHQMETLKECVEKAMELSVKGDIVLFSPAFASFGKWFKNEYDRGAQFLRLVEGL